jgi:small subunit ribosomal protein S16
MAVKIRMRQQGRKNRQTFRLVVTDIRNPRDGKYVETLGSYDPHRKENNLTVDSARLGYWISQGAILSERAEKLVQSVAPDVIRQMKEKQSAKRVKMAAKRRGKKEKIASTPKKQEEKVASAPKKKRAPAAKKAKADES